MRGGARYHMDCTVSLSGQHYCIFLPVREGKIRRNGVAALPGQTFYLPGNGHIYSDVDDSGVRYYRLRQKWALENGEMREIEQPYHYLGLASHYRGILKADDGTHDSKTPLRLLDRVDGKKNRGKNRGRRRRAHPPCRPAPALRQRSTTGERQHLHRPVAAHPEQGRQNRLGENQLSARHPGL